LGISCPFGQLRTPQRALTTFLRITGHGGHLCLCPMYPLLL
jgi:hypothetical protein